jgi:DNA-binding MarR family transcriptional regulator
MMHDHDHSSVPGHPAIDTSAAAAMSLASSLGYLQAKVLCTIVEAGSRGLTTNELAERLRIDRGSIQPRTSELRAKGRIRDSRQRRLNANGKKAIVWIAAAREAEVRHD